MSHRSSNKPPDNPIADALEQAVADVQGHCEELHELRDCVVGVENTVQTLLQ